MKKLSSTILMIISLLMQGFAQTDADGCQDHALLTRLENFYIASCEENYNELQFQMSGSDIETKEGNLFRIYYRYNPDAGVKAKSVFQVMKNYEMAITKNGGRLIYKNTNSLDANVEATFFHSTSEKEYWIQLASFAGTDQAVEAFSLNILEMESMKQEVDANQLFEALTNSGFVALNIHFETAKSVIKPESFQLIDQVVQMLQQNPGLRISIEGHTDNVGSASANQTLSEARANAVMNALVEKGIQAGRLAHKGWGQSKPVADNATEEGRAANRRVEIVKM